MKEHIAGRHKDWEAQMWPQQREWRKSVNDSYRNILVDRHSGITSSMAIEVIEVASRTERKQVFIGPTELQVYLFLHYATNWYGKEVVSQCNVHFLSIREAIANLKPQGTGFDVYVSDYLWVKDKFLEQLMQELAVNQPCRETWFSCRDKSPKYQLLEKVTYR